MFRKRAISGLPWISLLILSSTLYFPANSARAQGPAGGSSPLLAVQVTGSARFQSEQIASATGLQPGTSVTREDIQAGADRLAKLGSFSSVQYRYSTLGAGIKVEYQVKDAAEIPAAFDNFPWFSDAELAAGIKNAVPLFDGMVPAQGGVLDEISTAIQKMLDAKGLHVRVGHALSVSGVGDQQVQLFSAEGDALNVAAIEFSDGLASSDRTIGDRAIDLLGKPFSRSTIEIFELEQVRPVYLEHGFLRVKFDPPAAHFAGDAKSALPNKLVIEAPIEPGPTYTWGGVTWKGNYSIPAEILDDFVKLKTGDLADGMKIESAWEGVRNIYGQRGYLDAKVDAAPAFDDAGKRVAYTVSVDEGPQYHMGNLVLTGLSLDGEKRIRSAWTMAPGAVFNKSVYDEFVDTGIHKAFVGSPYRYEKIGRFLQENPQESKVDVLLDFQ
jgi:outer membrane translocation and assembly module TamA